MNNDKPHIEGVDSDGNVCVRICSKINTVVGECAVQMANKNKSHCLSPNTISYVHCTIYYQLFNIFYIVSIAVSDFPDNQCNMCLLSHNYGYDFILFYFYALF